MPVYNVEAYIAEAIQSVLDQTYENFELIVVDDGGSDSSMDIVRSFQDGRICIVSQPNRGLAGARNTGIANSSGSFVALLDSDDRWHRDKLMLHAIHLRTNRMVDVSYSGSQMIDAQGKPLALAMRPRLNGISAAHILKRNPVGNGSAPVIRRTALDLVRFLHPQETGRPCWFDENFRQSEDIELWIRMSAGFACRFEGIDPLLTEYRIVGGGLSANIVRQFESWQRVIDKARDYAPDLIADHGNAAAAYQLRYLARRALQLGDYGFARSLTIQALRRYPGILFEEPKKSLVTAAAALASAVLPQTMLARMAQRTLGQAGAA
ncbi:glucosyl transferase [Aurantiacibacter marinus]|uniref:Glucosyl transferase n=2 Tax=Aurantiacibacter marinus TaxID=874156 RepID=A0A0H0XS09_9SPHN|nr:glucosyl transferase [Aurantiacibacter marinus]